MSDYVCVVFIVEYDYDFYGYTDYRGGYSEPYYDELYADYYYDYPPNGGVAPAPAGVVPQRTSRTNNSVGLI